MKIEKKELNDYLFNWRKEKVIGPPYLSAWVTHPQPQMSGSPYFEVITNLTRQDISGGCKYIALHQILIKFKLFYNYLCSEFLVSIYPIISHLIFKLRNYKHGKFSLDSCILSLTFIMSVLIVIYSSKIWHTLGIII